MSAMVFVPNSRTLSSLTDDEIDLISQDEYEKFIIDLIFFNTDRHLSNVLAYLEVDENGKNHYKLALIDHGECCPDPDPFGEKDFVGLSDAKYEYVQFPALNRPLSESLKATIRGLSIDRFIEELKSDQKLHEVKFGDLCSIPDSCYDLIRFNLLLIKKSVELDCSFQEIALTHVTKFNPMTVELDGGEITEIFKACSSEGHMNWEDAEHNIESVLNFRKASRAKA